MWRNRELRELALWYIGCTFLFVAVGFALQPVMGVLLMLLAVALGVLFWRFTAVRYYRIAQLSAQIDQLLHNGDQLSIQAAEEGELSILESEIYKMTLRIREQNAALRQEKTHLADSLADIAHQLRTPLTAANLLAARLRSTVDMADRQALLRELHGLFAQMDWLLTALLQLSRLDAGMVLFQREPVAVHQLVQAALRPLQIALELHDVTVQVETPPNAVIQGDIRWLTEAVQNICKNCIESAGDGGSMEITCVDTLLYTELAIHDSGPGFAPEELPRLFERFYRGKNSSAAGYGIGLALCQNIVTGQGGTVTAKNHPNGGALFLLRFPK